MTLADRLPAAVGVVAGPELELGRRGLARPEQCAVALGGHGGDERPLERAGLEAAREYVTQIGRIKPQPLDAQREMVRAVMDRGYTLDPLDSAT